jgi:hypothetical protein
MESLKNIKPTNSSTVHKQQEDEFIEKLDNLFDMAHAKALIMMKISEETVSSGATGERLPWCDGICGYVISSKRKAH